jgi:tetratricopeptide (TPR) repeat protein
MEITGARELESMLQMAEQQSRIFHRHEEALRLVNEVSRRAARLGANLPARCRIHKAAILCREYRITEAVNQYQEALMMLSGSRDKESLLFCLEGLARNLITLHRDETARGHLKDALALATETGQLLAQERLYRLAGQLEAGNNRYAEAYSSHKAALQLAREIEDWAGAIADISSLENLALAMNQVEEKEMWEAERRILLDELEMLAYVGPSAMPRSEIIAASRSSLLFGKDPVLFPEQISKSESEIEDQYQQAQTLRKNKQHQEAVPLYLSVLSYLDNLDSPGDLSRCLNGLGISYRALFQEAVAQEANDILESDKLFSGFTSLAMFRYRLLRGPIGTLVEKARACHNWALELSKEVDDLGGQASQISNLAVVEEDFGNLDTAIRYQRWAIGAHRLAGEIADAVIDMKNVAFLEDELGNADAADQWRREIQEINRDN